MHVDQLKFDAGEAAKLVRKYKEHRAWSTPVDDEILKIASLVEKGKAIIRGVGSVELAGLSDEKLPKLAIGRADDKDCFLHPRGGTGDFEMAGTQWVNGNTARSRVFRGRIEGLRRDRYDWKAMAPHIPPDVRPRRGIQNYTLVWEALWEKVPPIDPILARRIGNSDFFVVLATWDVTPVERFVLMSRIGRQ
jgi:hypothetical protein